MPAFAIDDRGIYYVKKSKGPGKIAFAFFVLKVFKKCRFNHRILCTLGKKSLNGGRGPGMGRNARNAKYIPLLDDV